MAKDGGTSRLDELSDREIEMLEARLFCAGGPPAHVPARDVRKTACARDASEAVLSKK
jgi:hypothetical protein